MSPSRLLTFVFFFSFLHGEIFALRNKADSLTNAYQNAKTDTGKCSIAIRLAGELQKTNSEKSLFYAQEALRLAKGINNKKILANAYHAMGSALQTLGRYDEAIRNDSSCLLIREQMQDTLGLARILNNIGLVFSNKGESRIAIEYLKRSVELREVLNDSSGLPRSLTNYGLCFYDLGEYDKALEQYFRALAIAERQNNKDDQASSLNNIAIVYNAQEQYSRALDYYLRALKLKQELGVKKNIASTMGNIGTLYQEMKQYDKALNYQLEALKIREELKDKKGLGTTNNNIGSIFKDLRQYDKALQYCTRSLEIRREIGDQNGMANALANIAVIKQALGKKQEAVKDMEESTAIFEKTDDKGSLISNYELLADMYADAGNTAKAYEAMKKCLVTKDSVFKSDSQKRIADMQTKYETDKKQKEIELLNEKQEVSDLRDKRNLYLFLGAGAVLIVLFFFMYSRYQLKQRANLQLQDAYSQIERKNKDITDSIRYAKRIQEAILPPGKVVKKYVVDSFIYYKPKDIVSGDFYWMEHRDNKTLFAAVDCTGHGVPGAFMSIVGHNLLNQIVNERGRTKPGEILDDLNVSLCETLVSEEDASVKDGMDIALCCIDFESNILEYAGAYNSLYILRNSTEPILFMDEAPNLKMTSLTRDGITLTEIKADKQPIGAETIGAVKKFTNRKIKLLKGDIFYIFSDGYADQFGGPKGKKFKYAPFKNLLINMNAKHMEEQKLILERTITDWMDGREQVDDILVIGVKV
ncbi:MAG TPA: tetratricopeptide repeat protein [Bacteroidia bacterium]|jgi:tetratricopeptide (TPR) repeat protein